MYINKKTYLKNKISYLDKCQLIICLMNKVFSQKFLLILKCK